MKNTSVISALDRMKNSNGSPRAEFAYIDESGNSGPSSKGGTRTYTLGCVLVPLDQWTDRLDVMVEARKEIRDVYGVRLRDELKANYLLRGRGPLDALKLGDGQRRDIYQRLMAAANVAASGFSSPWLSTRSTRELLPILRRPRGSTYYNV